ncbi:MAG: cobalamin B12-binding domain-containing protein [Thermodesulfobacteriota bacterium]
MAAPLRGTRLLIAKPGLDGHDVGAKVIALALRDAGAEVIYTGLRKSPDYIARAAIDEDVDAIGLSILSGSHCALVEQVVAELEARDAGEIPLFVGGTIPAEDHDRLKRLGVRAIFSAEMELADVIATLSRHLRRPDRA